MPKWNLSIGNIKSITFEDAQEVSSLLGTVKLVSLKIQKEIYVPGHIEAILQIVPSNGVGAIDVGSLVGQFVTLNDDSQAVAKDYIVFECKPEYKYSQNTLYVTLDIYSPEHCLTFKKYNACYVAKKLGEDIFKTIAKENSSQIQVCDCSHLERITLTDTNGNNMEFIQPYLVQYNETALDFLNRVANECGVFLYYELGTWYLENGVSKTVQDLEKYDSLTYKKMTTQEEGTADANLVIGTKEEYMSTLTEKINEYSSKDYNTRLGFNSVDGWLFNITNWLKKANLAEIAGSVIFDVCANRVRAETKINDESENWNKEHIEPYQNSTEQCTKVDGKKVVCQFSNYNAKSSFGSTFYENIRKEEITASKKKMHINYDTYYQSLLLRDIIEYNDKDYYVSKISYTKDNMAETNTAYEHLEVDVIPLSNNAVYPPLLESKPASKIESQVGIVTANNDPDNMGRLQFRYKWQTVPAGEVASPWISIAQPFASKDAGLRFMPQVDDEIMIGYESGRLDRPFMIGGLTTETRKIDVTMNRTAVLENATADSYLVDSENGYFNNDFVLKSPSGQYIKFMVPSNANYKNFVTSFLPCVNAFHSYFPASCDSMTYSSTKGQKLSGGINIGDAYGFFNINLSTEKRKVLISSPVGDVQIDAFTGITLSAPNGNVRIEGKNVEIVAGNNLTLTSGANIDKMRKFYSENVGWAIASGVINAAVSFVKSQVRVDLRALRAICDAVLKPVGGTLLIKSKRFLRLEAGTGSTTLPTGAFKGGSRNQNNLLRVLFNNMKVKDTINATLSLMTNYENTINNIGGPLVKSRMNDYDNNIAGLKTLLKAYLAAGGTLQAEGRQLRENDITDEIFKNAIDIYREIEQNGENFHANDEMIFKIQIPDNDQNEIARSLAPQANGAKAVCINKLEALAQAVSRFLQSIQRINRNQEGMIQNDIITIGDTTLLPGSVMSYKNEILRLLSKEVGVNAIQLEDVIVDPAVPIHQNVAPTGVRLKIYDYFKNALANLGKLGVANQITLDSITKRKMLWSVIQVLREAELVTIKNSGTWYKLSTGKDDRPDVADNNDNVCETAENWKTFISCVKTYQGGVGAGFIKVYNKFDGFGLKDVTDMFGSWQKETFLYNPDVQGEILLSDTDGHTCTINNQSIKPRDNDDVVVTMKTLENI